MRFFHHIIVFLLMIFSPGISAQNFRDFINAYSYFRQKAVVEILTIHTDKDFYVSGEMIHFCINGYNGLSNNAGSISDIVCVELINEDNEIVDQQRLYSEKLAANGIFILSPESTSGYYTIQAYTSWNRNFGTSVIAFKHIKVLNPFNLRALTNIHDEFIQKPFYQITPHAEYLNILKNISNRIIIRSLNKFLQPVPGTGIVYNSVSDTLTVFNIDSSGLGSFNLVPEDGMKYFIQFLTTENDTVYFSLPPAVEGYGINTFTTEDFTELTFIRTAAFFYPDKLNLIITKGINIEYFAENIDLNGKPLQFESGKTGPGMYTAYLLTDSLEVITRRNFFIPPAMHEMKILTDKNVYSVREKIMPVIDNPGPDSDQIRYEWSVTKDYKVNRTGYLNVLANFLNVPADRKVELMNILPDMLNSNDNLMSDLLIISEPSVQIKDLFSIYNSKFSIPPEYKGEILSGQVLKRYDELPVADQVVCLTFKGTSVGLYNTRTDSSGRFNFYFRDSGNTGYITLTCYPQDENKIIHIDNHYYGNTSTDTLPPLPVSKDAKEELEELMLSVQVRNIYGNFFQGSTGEEIFNNNDFYGQADFNLDMAEFVRLPVMEEVFFEIVKGVMLDKSRAGTGLLVIDENLSRVIGDNPLILVNGIPYFDTRYLLNLDPADVDNINVVHYKYYLGNMVFNGIIDVRLKQGNINYDDLPPGAINTLFEPALRSSPGNDPDHSVQTPELLRIPDYRTVLYWNPDTRGDEKILFYASDLPGIYKIIVKEITNGKVTGYGCRDITVK